MTDKKLQWKNRAKSARAHTYTTMRIFFVLIQIMLEPKVNEFI